MDDERYSKEERTVLEYQEMTANIELLPEAQMLKSRRQRSGNNLIDIGILQSKEYLNDAEVAGLLEIREEVGLLGGKLNPVELVTINTVAAKKKQFLSVFGTPAEADFEFRYSDAEEKATMALRDGLESVYGDENSLPDMPLDSMLNLASNKIEELRERVRQNRAYIRQSRKDRSNNDTLRAKLAASLAMQGLVEDLASTLRLVRGISTGDDKVMAEAISGIYGRDITFPLKRAAEDYLEEMRVK